MWNNISTLAEKRTGMEELNSTYYNLIAKKPIPAIRPLRAFPLPGMINHTDVEEDEEKSVPVPEPDETYIRQNRHKRTRPPELVRPRTNPDLPETPIAPNVDVPADSNDLPAETEIPRCLTPSEVRLQTDVTRLAQESGTSQGINNVHSHPRAKLPYSPPSVNNLLEEKPEKVITRAQSQPFTGIHTRMATEILKTSTKSDHNFLGGRSSMHLFGNARQSKSNVDISTSPRKSDSDESYVSSRSVFDVEEDSKFEFYVEDQDSEVKASSKKVPASGQVQGTAKVETDELGVQTAKVETDELGVQTAKVETFPSPDLKTDQQTKDDQEEVFKMTTDEFQDADSDSREPSVVFSNPRYGSRYACKDADVISSVAQRNYDSNLTNDDSTSEPNPLPPGFKSTRYTVSEKLYKELPDQRFTLKPLRRCYSAFSPPNDSEIFESAEESPVQDKPASSVISKPNTNTGYKDSTQFLFPPVLSEDSFTSLPSKRKSRDTDFEEQNQDNNDYEAPDPDINAIREYNRQFVPRKNTSSPSTEPSSMHHRRIGGCDGSVTSSQLLENGSRQFVVSSRSSVVTNIPCNSWMMFPLRVLPGEMVPWGLLMFLPVLIVLMVLMGYMVVTYLLPFSV